MITCYKLTDQNHQTQNNTQWGENVTHTITEGLRKPELCSLGVLHYYRSIPMAFIFNPHHANINNPILWEADADAEVASDYGKSGCYSLTTKKMIRYNFTGNQLANIRTRFAIKCAEKVLHIFESKFPIDNRSRKTIKAAKNVLTAYAAYAADADYAAYAADYAAYAADYAAYAADADYAADAEKIDFDALATEAWIEEMKK